MNKMLEKCVDAVCQELYEHTRPADEMERATSETLVRAILNELKQVDEGMVEAGIPHSPFKDAYMGGIVARGIFTAMIQQILEESDAS